MISTTPDVQLWVAAPGGTDSLVRVSGDSTVGGGGTGYDIATLLAGHPQLHHPSDIIFDTVHDRFFIVDSDGVHDSILQGSISQLLGGGPVTLTTLYSQQPPVGDGEGITGVALDPENGIVYFTESNLVRKVAYDTADQVPVTLADLGSDDVTGGLNYANEIAFNPLTGQIFVVSTESFSDFVESPPGSGNIIFGTLVTRNAIYRIDDIAPSDVDATGNTVTKLEFDTHEQMNPFLGGPDTAFFPDELGMISGIDVDVTTGAVYFTTIQLNGGAGGEVGGIYQIGAGGGAHTTLYSEGNATDQNFQYIDVDGASGRYYVTSEEPGSGLQKVYTHSLSAGAPTEFATLTGAGGAQGLHVSHAPTLAVTGGATASETPAAGSGFSVPVILLTSAAANDLDSAGLSDQLAGATASISGGFGAAPGSAERLTINGTATGTLPSGISYSYDSATGVMTLAGVGSFADYEAALSLVAYSISGDNPDAYGAAPTRTVSFSVRDGLLSSDPANVTVTVAAANDAPVNTVGGPVTLLETDSSAAITGLAVSDVDADPANDSIQVTLAVTLGTLGVAGGAGVGVAGSGTGTVVLTGTQNAINASLSAANGVVYMPGASGADSLTMTTNDLGHSGSGGAQQDVDAVLITVINVNDPPTAPASGSVTTAEDTASAATAIGASDPNGDALTYSEKAGAGAAHGTVTFDQANGTYTYTPDADYEGSDGFTILIDDGNGGLAEQNVTVTVTPVNDAPTVPAANSASAAEDGASAPTAIGAADVDGDALAYAVKAGSGPANGSVTFDQAAGTFTYTPGADYNGADSFTIVVSDGNGGSAEQVVSVTVTPVNDAPTAPAAGSVTTGEDTTSAAQAIGASDVDGDTLTYSQKAGAQALHGSVVFNQANGTYTYTPDADYTGSDSFTILIDDGNGGTAEQAVSVNVTPVNDAPGGLSGNLAAPEDAVNGSAVGTVSAQDPDSSSFTYELLDDAGGRFDMDAAGNVTVQDGLLLDYEQQSVHTLQVRVTDDMGASAVYSIDVGVVDVLGEDVIGDARANTFFGGAENDVLRGMAGDDTLVGGGGLDRLEGGDGADMLGGGAGNDTLLGGNGNDVLRGGAGQDVLTGGAGNDVYVLTKGEANGDTIHGFFGVGASDGDSILLEGYGAGTTFTRVGNGGSNVWQINDNGHIEYVTIYATGTVHPTDVSFM